MPLLAAHWREIAHYVDIPLNPDRAVYDASQSAGILHFYTARDDENTLVGYASFFVRPNPHYAQSIQAAQDVIYVAPWARGKTGARFIQWIDSQLTDAGVQAVYHHVKAAHDFGPLLERMGYELVDKIYARRLDVMRGDSWSIQFQSDDWEKAAAQFATDGGD